MKLFKKLMVALIVLAALLSIGAGIADVATNLRVTKNISFGTATLASAAGNVSMPNAGIVVVTGTAKITRLAPWSGIRKGTVAMTWHTTTDTLVDGVNLKLAGNFNGTADDILTLCYGASGAAADTFWTEISRSAN